MKTMKCSEKIEVIDGQNVMEAHQRSLDIAAQVDVREGTRQGLEDVKKGRVRSAREALETFRRTHSIPR
jgi:hypothetical protein